MDTHTHTYMQVTNGELCAFQRLMTAVLKVVVYPSVFLISVELWRLTQPVFALGFGGD